MSNGWTNKADFTVDKPYGYQSANAMLQRERALASIRLPHFVGGDRTEGLPVDASALSVPLKNALRFCIDGDHAAGLTVQILVDVRTDDAGTSVTPRVWNDTTNAAASISGAAACTDVHQDYSQANQRQTLVLTPAAGVNFYHVELTAQNANALIYGIAYLMFYPTNADN